jgi:hypothetical protein
MRSAVFHSQRLRWRAILSAFLFAALSTAAFAADDAKKKPTDAELAMRPYRDGPLTAADYRCPPPNPLPQKNGVQLSAMTFTSLHYNTRYRWREVQPEKFEARLTSFDIVAEVDRRQSWTTRPTDERLLDHEQGHFDVSELNARRIQKKFNELTSSGGIIGRGSDEASSIADMNQQVESRVHDFLDQERKQQDQYDITTHHGTYHKSQAEERQKQLVALKDKTVPPEKKTSP